MHRVRRHPLITGLVVMVVLFLVASSVLFVWPAADQPRQVDAIVMLAGAPNESARETTALSLARKGYAPVVLFSRGSPRGPACPHVPQVSVVCFVPNPEDTIGEIRYATSYAHRHGWHSLLIVAGRTQVTRARLLAERCFSGQLVMIPARVPLIDLPYQVLYEWGALAKAVVLDEHC